MARLDNRVTPTAQVCGVCAGNDPVCIVCRGTGYDPAPPDTDVGLGNFEAEQIREQIDALFAATQRSFHSQIEVLMTGLKVGLYSMVMLGGLMMLAMAYLGFLIGFYHVFVFTSMLMLTLMLIASTIWVSYRVNSCDVEDMLREIFRRFG